MGRLGLTNLEEALLACLNKWIVSTLKFSESNLNLIPMYATNLP